MHIKQKLLTIIAITLFIVGNIISCNTFALTDRALTSAINKNPENTEASLQLIKYYLDIDQDAKAMIEINRIKNKVNDNPKFFILAANLLLKKGLLDEAEDMAKKAVKISYNNADAFTTLGNIYFEKMSTFADTPENQELKKNYLTKAFDSFYTAYKYNPASPLPYIGLANAYYMTGQVSLANDQIMKAKELGINNADAFYQLGEYYYKTKDYAKSKSYFEKSVSAGLTSKYKTYYLLGTIYEQDDDIQNAQKCYLKALKIKPDHLQSQQNLDRLIKVSYKDAEAISQKPKTTTDLFSDLNDELNMIMQADYYLVVDEFTRARELYKKILDKNPDNINAISGLAELYFAKWAEGFTNSTEFLDDSKYILKAKDTSRIAIPITKFKLINEDSMPEAVRQKFISLSVSETFDFYDLLNEVRAEFLLGNYEDSHEKLVKLLNNNLSNYEKFKVLKSLCYDHDYDEALLLINELKKTYYHNDEIEPIVSRINTKFSVIDDKLTQAANLYSNKDSKKNDYAGAEEIIKQALRYLPTSKKAYLSYAYLLEKQDKDKEAIEKAHTCLRLANLYPDKSGIITEDSLKKLIQKLNQELARADAKK